MQVSRRRFSLAGVLFTSCVLLFTLTSHTTSYVGKIGTTQKPDHQLEGCFCHYPTPDPMVNVGFKGPTVLAPGESAEYVVWVTRGSNKAGGFNVASWLGDLASMDSNVRTQDNELTHKQPTAPSKEDTILWTFTYKAPQMATVDTLYATAMNVDSSTTNTGDSWNYAPKFAIQIAPVTSLAKDGVEIGKEVLLYPQPSKDFFTLAFNVDKEDHYEIWLQDLNGRRIKTFIARRLLQGVQRLRLELEAIPSGHYFVVIKSPKFNYVKPLQISL